MKILILNGSPRANGNTAFLLNAFEKGCIEAGHEVFRFDVAQMNIRGCVACEYCHTKVERMCVQQDDMQKIYPVLEEAEMIVLASPIYYFSFTGQLQCAINRIYALEHPKKLKKAALILSSGSDDVFEGAIYEYRNSFIHYLKLEDMGIYTAYGNQNKSKEKESELYGCGKQL